MTNSLLQFPFLSTNLTQQVMTSSIPLMFLSVLLNSQNFFMDPQLLQM